MKLEEALRKTIRQFGVSVLQEKRLMFILSDFRAFEEFPAVKQVFQSIVSDGSGKELCRLFLDDDSSGCLAFAGSLKKSLAEDRHFKKELAGYAVDSITFALGLQTAVREPSDHGFDPMDEGNAEGQGSAATDKKTVSGSRAESSPADARVHEHPHMEKPKPADLGSGFRASATGSASEAGAGAVNKSSSFSMKWLAVLVLIAGAFAWGRLVGNDSGGQEPVQVQPAEESPAGNTAHGSAVTRNNGSAGNDVQSGDSASQSSAGTGQNESAAADTDAGKNGGRYEYDQGWNYERGLGVRQDYAEALKWYRKAAELGNEAARIRIDSVETLISRNNEEAGRSSSGTGQAQSDAGGEGEIEAFALGNRYFNEKKYAEAVKYYKRAAELGNAEAQTTLGWMYDQANGVRRNYAEAAKWYRKAAEQGNYAAQNNLGTLYYNGYGVKRNYGEALKWFRKAADQGNAAAYGWLGDMYYNGQVVKKNYGEAAKWYRKAAEQGNAHAQNELGVLYYNGQGVKRNYGEALKWFRKASDQGNAAAYSWLGSMYYEGQGVKKDYSEAAKWYRKAADQGNAVSQLNLGWMYENGQGVRQNNANAMKWYRKAAAQGNADAKERIKYLSQSSAQVAKGAGRKSGQHEYEQGWKYEHGQGVRQDYAEALKWYRKALAKGNETSRNRIVAVENLISCDWKNTSQNSAETANSAEQFAMGEKYWKGDVVDQDFYEAERWYRKSAEGGNVQAQLKLGEIYSMGWHVQEDYAEAAKWYRKAADQGNLEAQFQLCFMLERGDGVTSNYDEALKCYRKVAARGGEHAISYLKSLEDL